MLINVRIGEEIFGFWLPEENEKENLGKCLQDIESRSLLHSSANMNTTHNSSASQNVPILSKSKIGAKIDLQQLLSQSARVSAPIMRPDARVPHAPFPGGYPVNRHPHMHMPRRAPPDAAVGAMRMYQSMAIQERSVWISRSATSSLENTFM